MATAKIKYIGLKERETAFSVETSIVWTPDTVESVDLKHVEAMLKHPDVFALADAPVGLADAKPVAVLPDGTGNESAPPANKPSTQISIPDGPLVEMSHLDKAGLQALAKAHGVTFHHSHGAPKLIELLQAAFPVKPE